MNFAILNSSAPLLHSFAEANLSADVQIEAWPALFGADRDSNTLQNLNPVWTDDGPDIIWEHEVGTGYGSPVTTAGRVVFNHRVDDEEIVECLDVLTGQSLWQHRYRTTASCDFEYSDGPYSTPVIDPQTRRVFNVGGQGQFQCLNLDTGQPIWKRDLHKEYAVEADIFPVGASPLLHRRSNDGPGQLIFNLGAFKRGAGIIALNAATGETRWEATDHGPSYATPTVVTLHDQWFAFVLTDLGLVCLDPTDGQVDWYVEYFRRGDLTRNATSPLVHGNEVLVVCSGPGAMSLEILPDRTYRRSWRQRRTLDSQYNTLILDGGHVYSFTSVGQGGAELRCVRLEDGGLQWKYHSVLKRGMGLATPKALFLLGERGHLASLVRSPEKPSVISFTQEPLMSEPCYCSPAIYGDLLILKDEQRVAAFVCSY